MRGIQPNNDRTEIRTLGVDDYDAIVRLWKRSGLATLRPDGRDSRDAFARQLQPDPTVRQAHALQTALGLEQEGKLIGVVIATHDGRKGWINRLAIDPQHRKQGHAKRLISAAETALREQGMHVFGTLIERENSASLALFQDLGYQLAGNICYLSKRDDPEA